MIYGHSGTLHQTGEVNVELDSDGKVVSVWYRCMRLPFTQDVVEDYRATEMRHSYRTAPPAPIEAIEFLDV